MEFKHTAIVLTLLSLLSCGEKPGPVSPSTDGVKEFSTTVESDLFYWTSGDEVCVTDNHGHSALYTAQLKTDKYVLVFKSGDKLTVGGNTLYRAYYPSSMKTAEFVSTQTLASGDVKGLPMFASSQTTELRFAPMSGLVKVPVSENMPLAMSLEFEGRSLHLSVPKVEPGIAHMYFFLPEGSYRVVSVGYLLPSDKLCYNTEGFSFVVRKGESVDMVLPEAGEGVATTNLTSNGKTANCYRMKPGAYYRMYARAKGSEGVSSTSLSPSGVILRWSEGEKRLVYPPVFYRNFIYFAVAESEGNAYLSATDSVGAPVWGWHLWISDSEPGSEDCPNGAGTIMDRNLGALSSEQGSQLSKGLYYQWGRKEPSTVEFTPGSETNEYDWASVHSSVLWGNQYGPKSLEDPCPSGWRVPDGNGHGYESATMKSTLPVIKGFWNTSFGVSEPFSAASSWRSSGAMNGLLMPGTSQWLPASGYIDGESGELQGQGTLGSCWTRGVLGNLSYCLSYSASGMIHPAALSGRAAARNVRCVKE